MNQLPQTPTKQEDLKNENENENHHVRV